MSLTSRKRNIIIGFAAVLVIAAMVAAFFLVIRSGDNTGTTASTPTSTQTTSTRGQTTSTRGRTTATNTTPTGTQTVAAETGPSESPAPSETPAPTPTPAEPLEILSRTATPQVVAAGMPMAMEFTAEVRGNAASVSISLLGPLAGTISLEKGAMTPEGTTIWRAVSNAPAWPGIYHYYASAVSAVDGSTVEMPGTSAWTFQVTP